MLKKWFNVKIVTQDVTKDFCLNQITSKIQLRFSIIEKVVAFSRKFIIS